MNYVSNPAMQLVREVRQTKDIKEVAKLLSSGDWIAVFATSEEEPTFVLGRVDGCVGKKVRIDPKAVTETVHGFAPTCGDGHDNVRFCDPMPAEGEPHMDCPRKWD